jgi:hypothetical protein
MLTINDSVRRVSSLENPINKVDWRILNSVGAWGCASKPITTTQRWTESEMGQNSKVMSFELTYCEPVLIRVPRRVDASGCPMGNCRTKDTEYTEEEKRGRDAPPSSRRARPWRDKRGGVP